MEDVSLRHEKRSTSLVGTVAVETSDYLFNCWFKQTQVLNAKNHHKEAQIIMNAGQRGAVTIATNIAGRGTDIKLVKVFANSVDFVSSGEWSRKPSDR